MLTVIGGLGLFLYGMNIMGIGLQKAAGERLKKLIEVLTNNRLMGVIVGALVTMIIQSSSATTVMVVGFVNAGLMTLPQAVGVIMGANIGTTITAQLIAFNLTDYAPIAVAIGVGIWVATSKKEQKYCRNFNWFWYTIYWYGHDGKWIETTCRHASFYKYYD